MSLLGGILLPLFILNTILASELTLFCPLQADGSTTVQIIEGNTRTCVCKLVDPSNGAGRVQWIHPNGFVIAEGDGEAMFELGYNANGYSYCDGPGDWTVYAKGGTCVMVETANLLSWENARQACTGSGWDLVKISDEAFDNFIADEVLKEVTQNVYIGLKAEVNSGTFTWLDETIQPGFLKWDKSWPKLSSQDRAAKRCALTDSSSQHKSWQHTDCDSSTLAYMCQKDARMKDNHNETFTCRGTSNVGGEIIEKTVTTNFAFGPSEIRASEDEYSYDFDANATVIVKCTVEKQNSNPKPDVRLRVDASITPDSNSEDEANVYVFKFAVIPSIPGRYAAECVASNPVESSLETSASFQITALGLPRVEFDCPNDYIKENDGRTCTCRITHVGVREEGSCFVKLNDGDNDECNLGSLVVELTDRFTNSGEYHCTNKASNPSMDEKYTPMFAYGPDAVEMDLPGGTNYTFLDGGAIQINCLVPRGTFQPYIDVVISVNNEPYFNTPTKTSDDRNEIFKFMFSPTEGGIIDIACVASNSKFSEINAKDSKTLTINQSPKVGLDSSCESGYLKEGLTHTCTCIFIIEGHPPVSVHWYDDTDKLIPDADGNESDGTATLESVYNAQRSSGTSTCQAVEGNGTPTGNSVTYTPKFAFGPEIVTISSVPSPAIKLCPGESRILTIDCKVPKDTAMPDFNFKENLHPSHDRTLVSYSSKERVDDNDFIIQRYTYNLNTSGEYSAICLATNSEFEDISTNDTATRILVVEPPPEPPKMEINDQQTMPNGDILVVHVEDRVAVNCSAKGGYPEVDNVTLNCGPKVVTTNQVSASLSLNIDKSLNQKVCTCMAQHMIDTPGCYKETSSFTLDVRYPPEIAEFTIGSTTSIHTVPAGSNAVFMCRSEGNLKPVVSVVRQLSKARLEGNTTEISTFVSEFRTVLLVDIKHSDIYDCISTNDDGLTKSSVTLIVSGAPKLYEPDTNYTATISSDERVSAQFDIISNPHPTTWALVKTDSQQQIVMSRVTNFNATHNVINLQHSVISIDFVSKPYDAVNYYQLIIGNDQGQLVIPFTAQGQRLVKKVTGVNMKNLIISLSTVGATVGLLILALLLLRMKRRREARRQRRRREEDGGLNRNPFYSQTNGQRLWMTKTGAGARR